MEKGSALWRRRGGVLQQRGEPRIRQIGGQKKLKRTKASWAIFLLDITINLK